MQVMPDAHRDILEEFGGQAAVLDPAINFLMGARILKDCIRMSGSLQGGLQRYNGAARDSAAEYAQKVIAEKRRLIEAARRAGVPASPRGG